VPTPVQVEVVQPPLADQAVSFREKIFGRQISHEMLQIDVLADRGRKAIVGRVVDGANHLFELAEQPDHRIGLARLRRE